MANDRDWRSRAAAVSNVLLGKQVGSDDQPTDRQDGQGIQRREQLHAAFQGQTAGHDRAHVWLAIASSQTAKPASAARAKKVPTPAGTWIERLWTRWRSADISKTPKPGCGHLDVRCRNFSTTKVPFGSPGGYDRRHERRPESPSVLTPKCLLAVYGSPTAQ